MEHKFKVSVDKSGFKDITLVCIDCKVSFLFSAGEQAYFAFRRDNLKKNGAMQFPPSKRCKLCACVQRLKHAKVEGEIIRYKEKLKLLDRTGKFKELYEGSSQK